MIVIYYCNKHCSKVSLSASDSKHLHLKKYFSRLLELSLSVELYYENPVLDTSISSQVVGIKLIKSLLLNYIYEEVNIKRRKVQAS